MDFAERTGHGIPQVIDKYGEGIFNITDSFILVTLPYDNEVMTQLNNSDHQNEPPKTLVFDENIIKMIKDNPYVTFEEVADELNISIATVRRIFSRLRKKGIIESRINQYDKWCLKEYK